MEEIEVGAAVAALSIMLPLRSIVLWICLALLAAGPGTAADGGALSNSIPGSRWVIRQWGTEAGLPQNSVNCMVQTREGYLWIGTREGLARFDGMKFRVFGLEDGLRSIEITALYEDAQGVLWVGTSGGGLSRYRDGRIERVALTGDLTALGSVTTLNGDEAGRLWIGSPTGLMVLDGDQVVEPAGLQDVSRRTIRFLARRSEGGMWIATQTGLFEFDGIEARLIPGPAEQLDFAAHCLLEDRNKALWVSIGNWRMLHLDREKRWRVYQQSDGLPFAFITCLEQTRDGAIWAGSLDDGLYRFDGERFRREGQQHGLSSAAIRSLLTDREGTLWVGTRTDGLSRLASPKMIHYGRDQGLTNDFTRAVAQTQDGVLYAATTGGGLYRGVNGWFTPFPDDESLRFFANVDTVLLARDGSLWWGASGALVRWTEGRLATVYRDEPWVRFNAIRALCEDPQGAIWVGTSRGLLVRHLNGSIAQFGSRIPGGTVTAMAADPDGSIWVGSVAGGVMRVRWGEETVHPIPGLPSPSVRSLLLDKAGILWIGTAGGGLSRWHQDRLFNYGSRQGLSAETVSQIVEDDHGSMWLGTSRGIVRVGKQDLEEMAHGKLSFLHPRFFGWNDGMPEEECSSGFSPAGLKLRDGRLCFPTVKGLILVDPQEQVGRAPLPIVRLEEVRINGRLLNLAAVPQGGTLQIPPGARELEVDYTGISLSVPERVRFRYRLEGINSDWVEAGSRRTAHFPAVPPGHYDFVVMACSADGVWAPEAARLKLSVKPYLWETTAFKAVSFLLVLAILGTGLRLVERRRFHRRFQLLQMQHAVQKERLRISQDMHDHLGGILTQVSQLSDLGLGEVQDRPQVRGRFERIGVQARLAVQSLDEIIWATDPKNDNLPRFVDYLSRFTDEFFDGTAVRCWQDLPSDLPHWSLRSDLRHNVFLACREALNNILKHARATEVWLRLRLENQNIQIEFEDNGQGFDAAHAGDGHGLGNMRKRLDEEGGSVVWHSRPGKGTRVILKFPIEPSKPA